MYVKKIEGIKNYRNLSDLEFELDREINFIVGENNIGKTNLIELLNIVINTNKFYEQDFYDIQEPIKVEFQIKYDDDELGFFENIFDIDEEYSITIIATQENVDSRIEYCHKESGAYIAVKKVKMLNFLYYSSLRSPNKELNFTRNVGSGKVLNYIAKKSLESKELNDIDLINKDDVDEVINDINNKFEKLNGLSCEKIGVFFTEDKENIINRILEIGDMHGRNISKLGDGLRYSFNIFLSILEMLVHLKTTKKDEDFESILIKRDNGERILPIIIGLDEPEIHQHPYRQRALIKSIKEIISNQDEDFLEIIKMLFNVDGFVGQVFVVTHSPNILLDDYKQIVRIYKKEDSIGVINGDKLNFNSDVHKHLKRSFIYFKEAMFAKSVILVEGDTEYGALPVLAEKLGYDLDKEGVGIIKMDGADAVLKYLDLFENFNIDNVAILDRDKKDKYEDCSSVRFTEEEEFEDDMFDKFTFEQYLKYLENIGKHQCLIPAIKDKVEGFDPAVFNENPTEIDISVDKGEEIMLEIREKEIKMMKDMKNTINGSLLATYVDEVPNSFADVIKETIRRLNYE